MSIYGTSANNIFCPDPVWKLSNQEYPQQPGAAAGGRKALPASEPAVNML